VVLGDRPGTIQLFRKHDAHDPMRQGHARDANQAIGARLQLRIEAVGAADQEGDVASVLLPGFQLLG
jgi:hypothetical protein